MLDPVWQVLKPTYKILGHIGLGSYGHVVKAIHRQSKKVVAIKLMKNVFKNEYDSKRIVSEIQILRKLSTIKENIYTVKLLDVITSDFDTNDDDKIDFIFLVMEHVDD